jgi:hypothetical protein
MTGRSALLHHRRFARRFPAEPCVILQADGLFGRDRTAIKSSVLIYCELRWE